MKRLIAVLVLVLFVGLAIAQVGPVRTITIRDTVKADDTCPTDGLWTLSKASGEIFRCDGANWKPKTMPDCGDVDTDADGAAGPSPPSGACVDDAACQASGTLYLCNAGTWGAVSGGGGAATSFDADGDGTPEIGMTAQTIEFDTDDDGTTDASIYSPSAGNDGVIRTLNRVESNLYVNKSNGEDLVLGTLFANANIAHDRDGDGTRNLNVGATSVTINADDDANNEITVTGSGIRFHDFTTCNLDTDASGNLVCGTDAVGYDEVMDEGSGLTQRAQINFTGAGVSCVDNAGATRTDCTISGGGGGGDISVDGTTVSNADFTTNADVAWDATGSTVTARALGIEQDGDGTQEFSCNGTTCAADTNSDGVADVTFGGAGAPGIDFDAGGTIDADADSDGTGTLTLTGIMALNVDYMDIDADADGTAERRICGDYDQDSTLEWTDIQSCIDTFCDQDSDGTPDKTHTGDFDFDGTNETREWCGEVVLLGGVWTSSATYAAWVSEGLEHKWDGLWVRGVGMDETIIKAGISAADIVGQGSSNVGADYDVRHRTAATTLERARLSDLTILGIETRATIEASGGTEFDIDNDGTVDGGDAGDHVLIMNDCADCVVERVRLSAGARQGLNVDADDDEDRAGRPAIFRDSIIEHPSEHCVEAYAGDVVIENSVFRDCRELGIAFWSNGSATASNIIIRNNIVDGASTGIRIYSGPSSTLTIERPEIVGNRIIRYDDQAIVITPDNTSTIDGAVIRGNSIPTGPSATDNTVKGLIKIGKVTGSSGVVTGAVVESNQIFFDETVDGTTQQWIGISGGGTGNAYKTNDIRFIDDGMRTLGTNEPRCWSSDGSQETVEGNTCIMDCGDSVQPCYGFYLSETADDVTILNNFIASGDLNGDGTVAQGSIRGIHFAGADGAVVTSNTITNLDTSATGGTSITAMHVQSGPSDNLIFKNNTLINGSSFLNTTTAAGPNCVNCVVEGNHALNLSSWPVSQDSNDTIYIGPTNTWINVNSDGIEPDNVFGIVAIPDADSDGTIEAPIKYEVLNDGYMDAEMTVFRPLSAPPQTCSATYEGAVYYDTDINKLCVCNVTNWVQTDDYSTVCS